jgi:hypothetical protein
LYLKPVSIDMRRRLGPSEDLFFKGDVCLMKYLTVLLLMAFLTACGPAAAPANPTPQVEVNSPLPEPESASLSNSPLETPTPNSEPSGSEAVAPTWNSDPTNLVVSATFCCGFTTPLVRLNYIADASVWGDGRIVWVEYDDQAGRQVLTDVLTPAQLEAFLQQAITAGFFEWEDRYADQSIADAADQCLTINLIGQAKQVCQYVQGAPAAFTTLYETVADGAGATGTAFIPAKGYLTATPVDLPPDSNVPVNAEWPAQNLDFSLSEATDGLWVEGEILTTAWEIINPNWQGMILQEGEATYQLSLQMPDLSYTEPPVAN